MFQRTPSSVDVRANSRTDPEWFAGIATPGWQQRWMENWAAHLLGGTADDDLVQDNWTAVARRIRSRIAAMAPRNRDAAAIAAAYEDAEFEKMEEIRARVDAVIHDPRTAEKLKAWYRQLCKRPCFHDEYLQAYNRPNTHLVDTDGKGVQRITAAGVVVAGREYEVDCVIYASGFEVGTHFTSRAGFDMTGRDGVRLSGYWEQGMRTLHGIHVRGFPNAFLVQGPQGANMLFNFPHDLSESAKTIAAVVKRAVDGGFAEVEVTQQAQDAWVKLLLSESGFGKPLPGCTPGYYNYEGQDPGPWGRLRVGYPGKGHWPTSATSTNGAGPARSQAWNSAVRAWPGCRPRRAHCLPLAGPGSAAAVGGKPGHEPDNVRSYRFVKGYPAKTGVNSTRSGKPSRCWARRRVRLPPVPGIRRIPGAAAVLAGCPPDQLC